jgi:hypothetical protein
VDDGEVVFFRTRCHVVDVGVAVEEELLKLLGVSGHAEKRVLEERVRPVDEDFADAVDGSWFWTLVGK